MRRSELHVLKNAEIHINIDWTQKAMKEIKKWTTIKHLNCMGQQSVTVACEFNMFLSAKFTNNDYSIANSFYKLVL